MKSPSEKKVGSPLVSYRFEEHTGVGLIQRSEEWAPGTGDANEALGIYTLLDFSTRNPNLHFVAHHIIACSGIF